MILETVEEACLWRDLAALPRLAVKTVEIGACGGKRARTRRTAKLDLCAAKVKLEGREPVDMLAVSATEPEPPAGKDPLNWLLSTENSADAETARTIEKYSKVLKTGTRVEDLRKCVAFDAITACHVFDLERIARDTPDIPANHVVTDDEIAILHIRLMACAMVRARPPPEKPPDIRTFVIDVARCAGFDPQKRQPLPGTQLLWKGYLYLQHATLTYRALKNLDMIKNETDTTGGR
ncbi:MAG: hypothetical protein OXF51_10295 [Alphaproteobacteria bacterium]|nr:hypothetical protein [Alphaproteobacteria bacterium]